MRLKFRFICLVATSLVRVIREFGYMCVDERDEMRHLMNFPTIGHVLSLLHFAQGQALSAAKGLSGRAWRSFAALRMTLPALVIKIHQGPSILGWGEAVDDFAEQLG